MKKILFVSLYYNAYKHIVDRYNPLSEWFGKDIRINEGEVIEENEFYVTKVSINGIIFTRSSNSGAYYPDNYVPGMKPVV